MHPQHRHYFHLQDKLQNLWGTPNFHLAPSSGHNINLANILVFEQKMAKNKDFPISLSCLGLLNQQLQRDIEQKAFMYVLRIRQSTVVW